jgi:hypothetical protein
MLPGRDILKLAVIALVCASGCSEDANPPSGDASSSGGSSGAATETTAAASTGEVGCDAAFNAIVTDIDETLTISDAEFTMQIADGTYDPMAREGAAELITAYADLGYRVLYLTARADTIVTSTGESAEDATHRWLMEHGFPMGERTEVQLASSFVINSAAAEYKAQAIMDRQAAGWVFDYAYGNALSDIQGYATAGIAKDDTFIIGDEAGAEGTVAVAGEGWVEHTQTQMPTVEMVCDPAM